MVIKSVLETFAYIDDDDDDKTTVIITSSSSSSSSSTNWSIPYSVYHKYIYASKLGYSKKR